MQCIKFRRKLTTLVHYNCLAHLQYTASRYLRLNKLRMLHGYFAIILFNGLHYMASLAQIQLIQLVQL